MNESRASAGEAAPRRQPQRHQWYFVATAHWRAVARCPREIRQLELDLSAFPALERQRCLGERGRCSRRDDGRERALQHRQHDSSRPRLGSGRKRGVHQRALGRSRGGFTSKVHCLGDARGRPIAFDLTPGEAADCKTYDTLIDLSERVAWAVSQTPPWPPKGLGS